MGNHFLSCVYFDGLLNINFSPYTLSPFDRSTLAGISNGFMVDVDSRPFLLQPVEITGNILFSNNFINYVLP